MPASPSPSSKLGGGRDDKQIFYETEGDTAFNEKTHPPDVRVCTPYMGSPKNQHGEVFDLGGSEISVYGCNLVLYCNFIARTV